MILKHREARTYSVRGVLFIPYNIFENAEKKNKNNQRHFARMLELINNLMFLKHESKNIYLIILLSYK